MLYYATALKPKLTPYLGRTKMVSREIDPRHHKFCWILVGVHAKNLEAAILFVNFTKVFDSIHRGKMEQILLTYGLPKDIVAAIMMFYRNTKVKVRSLDGDTDYFDIVADVLQGDTLALYLFIICLDHVLRTSIDKIKENGFKLTKKQKVPCKNNYQHWLCWWYSASGKCICPSWNSAT